MHRTTSGHPPSTTNSMQANHAASLPVKVAGNDPTDCKLSDDLADSCKTFCKICGEAFFLVQMRSHTLKQHDIQITKYKEVYGQFDIIEKVYHKCHLCSRVVLLDSDTLGGHIKGTHKMKEKDYKEQYCINTASKVMKAETLMKNSGIKKIQKKLPEKSKSVEKPFDPFTDVYYDCDLKHCDQCDRQSLVVQLAAQKEASPKKEGDNFMEEDEKEGDGLMEEDEVLMKGPDEGVPRTGPLYTKSLPLAAQSVLEAELLSPSRDDSSSDPDSSLELEEGEAADWSTSPESDAEVERVMLTGEKDGVKAGVLKGDDEKNGVMDMQIEESDIESLDESCDSPVKESDHHISYSSIIDDLGTLGSILTRFEPV